MSFDKIFDLTAGVHLNFIFYSIYIYSTYIFFFHGYFWQSFFFCFLYKKAETCLFFFLCLGQRVIVWVNPFPICMQIFMSQFAQRSCENSFHRSLRSTLNRTSSSCTPAVVGGDGFSLNRRHIILYQSETINSPWSREDSNQQVKRRTLIDLGTEWGSTKTNKTTEQ